MIDKVRRRMPWSKGSSVRISDNNNRGSSNGSSPHGSGSSPNRPRFSSFGSEASFNTANTNNNNGNNNITPNRQRLPSSGDSSTMSIGSNRNKGNRVSSAEERLSKARRLVDSHLKKISHVTGQHYSLNRESGMCYFPYQRFIVVLEVPADHPELLYMYTCVCKIENDGDAETDNHSTTSNSTPCNLMALMQTALELNYMQHRTRGATLGMEHSEVNLCCSVPLAGLTPAALQKRLDDFLQTTTQCHVQLERAKRQPMIAMQQFHTPTRSSVKTASTQQSDSPESQQHNNSPIPNRPRNNTYNMADLPEEDVESGSGRRSVEKPNLARRSSC